MKKIMIAAALVCAAMFANAAKYDWKITKTAGAYYYAFNGNYASQITEAFGNTEIGGTAAFQALNLEAFSSGSGGKSKSGSLDSGAADYVTYLVVDPSLADGNGYTVVAISTAGMTYDGSDPSPGYISWEYTGPTGTIAKAAGPIPPEPIPEPTSGLLLLLGVAGMALRRRRA